MTSEVPVRLRLVAAGHLLGVPLLASLVIEPDAVHDLVSARTWLTIAPAAHP